LGGRKRIESKERRRRSRRQTGLTLIELLVVMSILALGASVVLLNAPPSQPPARTAAENFAAQARAAFAAAVIEGASYKMEIRELEYAVWRYNDGEWRRTSRISVGGPSDDIIFRVEITDAAAANALALNGESENLTNRSGEPLAFPIDPLGGGPSAIAHFESRRGDWAVLIAPNGAIATEKR
jgi:prepilin-type N-terminal cleavage/methylation domain-containing protein